MASLIRRPVEQLVVDLRAQYLNRSGAEIFETLARIYMIEGRARGCRPNFPLTRFGHALGLDTETLIRLRERARWQADRAGVIEVGGKGPACRKQRWVRDGQIVEV